MTYASYTYEHPNWLVRFPHLKRMHIVSRAIGYYQPERWLDYGGGDGSVIKHVAEQIELPSTTVLYDPDVTMLQEARESLTAFGAVRFVQRLDDAGSHPFDMITALEVLEHLPLPERLRFYRYVAKHLSPDGCCLVEVPVEHGPIVLAKEYGRLALKHRKSMYSTRELLGAGLFGRVPDKLNRYDPDDERTWIGPHYGFDCGRLASELRQIGSVHVVKRSPFPLLPRALNQCILLRFAPEIRQGDVIADRILAFAATS